MRTHWNTHVHTLIAAPTLCMAFILIRRWKIQHRHVVSVHTGGLCVAKMNVCSLLSHNRVYVTQNSLYSLSPRWHTSAPQTHMHWACDLVILGEPWAGGFRVYSPSICLIGVRGQQAIWVTQQNKVVKPLIGKGALRIYGCCISTVVFRPRNVCWFVLVR